MKQQQSVKLLVFTRDPVPGKVKTRLQPEFSQHQSLRLHKKMIHNTLEKVSGLEHIDIELCCAGDSHSDFFVDCAGIYSLSLSEQQGSDLGERMYSSMQQALAQYDKVVIIGTDCPALDEDYIRSAVRGLNNAEVVIGPAEDGGYVLLGLNKISAELFLAINWGTASVLQQTRDRIKKLNWKYTELETLHDVDRAEDLHRYKDLLIEVS